MQNANAKQSGENTEEDLQVPVGLKIEFLGALKAKDLQQARRLCQMILLYEPQNPEAREFLPLIQKKLLEEQHSSDSDNDEEDDDSESDGEPSESPNSSLPSDEEQEKKSK
uniref:glutamate-rich protein 2 n=1 Tax=Doryrhamphus excisus TaxID=161450 RepID=UPI0025ADD300|nr:glutamate-rich protein 2 [Doryrhamphus excisus]